MRHSPRATFQSPPFAQAKLIRVIRGAIWDVAMEIRAASATYGHWVAEPLGSPF